MMRLGSLFTGTGGLDLAATAVLPVEHAWVCDNDPATTRLLAHHWPEVPNLGDITTIDWTAVESVDVLTAGFPCQPVSAAGRRAGLDDERWLFDAILTACRDMDPSPRLLLLENVPGLLSASSGHAMGRIVEGLAAHGYVGRYGIFRASDIGAPHRRERWFCIAAANTDDLRSVRTGHTRGWRGGPAHDGLPVADATGDGRNQRGPEHAGQCGRSDVAQRGAVVADPDGDGREGRPQLHREPHHDREPHGHDADRRVLDWGRYEPAIQRWEQLLGRPAPVPTTTGTRGGQVLNPALTEWMMGLPDGWITHVPSLSRNDILRLAGNGVVPQQAEAAYRWLLPQLEGAEVMAA